MRVFWPEGEKLRLTVERLEPISKMHLPAACGVAGRLNLLTY
jgi:hypothetical protein